MSKINILSLQTKEFKEMCVKAGLKGFVATQVFEWVFKKSIVDFDKMPNISKANSQILAENFEILPFKSSESLDSKEDNAKKCMLTLNDGQIVECVILKEKDYYTLCVSSQVGCGVDCKFCLTGVAGFKRNLKVEEIVAQVIYANSEGYPISRLVFMGMGEPLLNLDSVINSIELMHQEDRLELSKRKVTVSTSGYLQGIKELIKREFYINLAFSVGSADPLKRAPIMPIENRNPIMEVAREIKRYQNLHNRKLTLEYTLLEGKNDSEFEIKSLVNLARYLDAKVNLINLNPHKKIPFRPVSEQKLKMIRDTIRVNQVPVTIRFKKGQDITAACGQLGESLLK
ncbi:23S rRNA (adenine(2503)-C(2))-methyltransferase RlmN [Candidatus Marinamargulisbacteria bacterium SCGC AAA071-K20]|nr:23S rRNA (adenine(2503)-C(2))-methyltransferase RlmN [Candidatus Marinamargulisbacteria bacterium SCGC AAA071-K20]